MVADCVRILETLADREAAGHCTVEAVNSTILVPVPRYREVLMSLYGLFAVMVFLEMVTFVLVASEIGWGWAILIVLGTAVVGAMVVRRAGIAVFRRVRQKVDQGQMPGRELSDGFAMLTAGVLLITPGFIADLVGLLLLLPAVRDVVYRFSSKRLSNRFTVITSTHRVLGREQIAGEIIDIEPEDDL